MSTPTTSIGFSPTTPTAPAGCQNTVPQSDGGTPLQKVSEYVPNTGGASVKTADYTLAAADCGKKVVLNSASVHVFTLPATPPSVGTNQWEFEAVNMGVGTLTVTATSGAKLDGVVGGSLTLAQNTSCSISTDGTDYYSGRGVAKVKARAVTFKLTAVAPSDPIVINFAGTIVGWSIIGNSSFTASVDIWFLAGSAPPTAPVIPAGANKISASAPMALASAQTAAGGSSAISTWTTAVSQWGTIMANATVLPALATVMVQIFLIET